MATTTLQVIHAEHKALAGVLRSLGMMLDRGPGDEPERFFGLVRAMLFYIDEFPERLHHPKESDLLFPRVARLAPELMPVIGQLENDHLQGESKVRNLQHLLLAWELIGETRRAAFVDAARDYLAFYLEHMRIEETVILPAAERLLGPSDWEALDEAFGASRDPLAGGPRDPSYERLFTRIVMSTPAPIGVGPSGSAVADPGAQASIG